MTNLNDRYATMLVFDSEDNMANFRDAMTKNTTRSIRVGIEVDEDQTYFVVMVYADCGEDSEVFYRNFRDIANQWYRLLSVVELDPLEGMARRAFLVAWRAGEFPRKDSALVASGRFVKMLQRGVTSVPRRFVFTDGTEWALNLKLLEH
jgi:hypothetical protein